MGIFVSSINSFSCNCISYISIVLIFEVRISTHFMESAPSSSTFSHR
ncbi:Uncharacterised protein [Vibrio cholerae]|nr:Uncharacterised protein [Vibrio cholerae]